MVLFESFRCRKQLGQVCERRRGRRLHLEPMERREMMTADVSVVGPRAENLDIPAVPSEIRSWGEAQVSIAELAQSSLAADANSDGMVNGRDYMVWAHNVRTDTSRGSTAGEFDGNGTVDGLDYLVWAKQVVADTVNEAEPSPTSLSADANDDGEVNGRDYITWANNIRTDTSRGSSAGEFDGNGTVDGLDYLVWAKQMAADAAPAVSRLDGWDLDALGVPLPTNDGELIETLNMLPPLPKLHHSSPWNFGSDNPELGEAIARTTGSVGLSTLHHDTLAEVRRAVKIAKATGAVVDFQYSPYHRLYAKSDPRDWGDDFEAALAEINSTFATAAANFAQAKILEDAPDVRVGIVMADQELLRSDIGPDGKIDPYGPHYADQLEAVRVKNDLVYLAAKAAFPDATFVWHGFPDSPYHSPDQLHDGVASTELYANRAPETLRYMVKDFVTGVDAFNAAIEPHSQRQPLTLLMPAVSVGGFYDVSVDTPHPGYVSDEPYPVKNSWFKGRDLNHPYFASERSADRYGPTYRIEEIYLWPAPMENDHVGYYEHLVAYVAGAANLKMSEGGWLDHASR